MTKTKNRNDVEAAYQDVADHAESIRNDQSHDLSMMEPGDEWRQGDIAIRRLPDGWDKKHPVERIKSPSSQLATGNTQGSRHCLDSLAGVILYKLRDGTPLDGPIIVTTEPRNITHPEHGDCENLPPGCYAITFQRAFAEELRAVLD